MPTVTITGKNFKIRLPDICPVCLMPATQRVSVHNAFTIIMFSQSLTTEIRFCDAHYREYQQSLILEKVLSWISLLVCVAIGVGILMYVGRILSGYTQVGILLFLGIVGAGAGVVGYFMVKMIIRMLSNFLVLPRHRAVRDALRVKSFNVNPGLHNPELTRVTFTCSDEEYARRLAAVNQTTVEY